jgi:hypothetical protein
VDADAVEVFVLEGFDADDAASFRRVVLLQQDRSVETPFERRILRRRDERGVVIEAANAGAASADVRLDDQREHESIRDDRQQRRMVHDPSSRNGKSKLLEQRDLQRLARLESISSGAVEDVDLLLLEVAEVVVGVEDGGAAAAFPRRRTHPVEHERGTVAVPRRLARIESMLAGVDEGIRRLAPVELMEERPEPVRVFVVDRDGTLRRCHFGFLSRIPDGASWQAIKNPRRRAVAGWMLLRLC